MYKIRKDLRGMDSPFYVNVAVFHLPRPVSSLTETLDELPIIKIRCGK